MIEIISGEKGKGKTKELLNKVNTSITSATGNIVYLDKSQKHMYELNNKIRLINVNDFLIDNCDEFLGFICGVISQDHDLEEMYLDSFLTIASIDSDELLNHAIQKLDVISEKYPVNRTNDNQCKQCVIKPVCIHFFSLLLQIVCTQKKFLFV